MHQKLSASMFRNTSSCKLETLKFSTSSSAKSHKTKENNNETEKENASESQRGRKMEEETDSKRDNSIERFILHMEIFKERDG